MSRTILTLLAFSFITFSCINETKEHNNNWTYQGDTGPDHWQEIGERCHCNGKEQSPINIIAIDVVDDSALEPLEIFYSDSVKIHDVTNNGHTIQYNFEHGDYILLSEKKYELKQIHFHEASEHTINGIRFPLEVHLVHISGDNEIAVLATLAQEGGSSEAFDFLESYLPIDVGETKAINDYFDLNLNLPTNRDYYHYEGSLTTPPCTEGVKWYVFKDPITVSVDQVKQLQKPMPINNFRNEQSLNNRTVKQMLARD